MATILLLDDDPEFHALVQPALEGRGHRVVACATGAHATRELAAQPVDLAVVDGLLPDTDGLTWIAHQRADGRPLRIVFVSAFWKELRAPDRRVGELLVDLVLLKPVLPEVFAAQVEGALGPAKAAPPSSAPATSPAPDGIEDELAALVREYAQGLPDKLTKLREACAHLDDPASIAAARMLAHRLAGTAGSYGFDAVGAAASRLEELFIDRTELSPSARSSVAAALVDIAACIDRAAGPRAVAGTRGRLLLAASTALGLDPPALARASGFDIVTAGDPDEAVELARAGGWDAAAVAVNPGAPEVWYALARKLRAQHGRQLPLVVATSRSERRRGMPSNPGIGDSAWLVRAVENARRELLRTALVADPDPASFQAISTLLRRAGLAAVQVLDPSELVKRAAGDVELVVLETCVGTASGFDLCRLIRQAPGARDVPVLVVAADVGSETRAAAYRAGADDVLVRPVVADELLARIRVQLERRRLQRERVERDPLTGLLQRPALLQRLAARLADSPEPVAFCLLDLDSFRVTNARHGQAAGDEVLAQLGKTFAEGVREGDLCARWGGQDFALVLEADPVSARRVVARLAATVSALEFRGRAGKPFHVTFGAGLAGSAADGPGADDLAAAGDRRLQAAKTAGPGSIVGAG